MNQEFVPIHQAIKTLQERVEAGTAEKDHGICGQLMDILENEMNLDSVEIFDPVSDWFDDWPEHSGVSAFPVPGCGGVEPLKAFYNAYDRNSMWTGEYGASRKRLLAYIEKRAHFAAYVN